MHWHTRTARGLAGLTATALLATASAVAMGMSPAGADSVTTQNACRYSLDGNWRDLAVTLEGTAAADSTSVTLSGARLQAGLPEWMPTYGYNLGYLQAGLNTFPTKVWVALAGQNTTEGVQVAEVEATATTTITVDGQTVSATPIAIDVALPDTTWTRAGDGPVAFSQAGPDSLPDGIPAGVNGAAIDPDGSIYVSATMGNARFNLDCQPGHYTDEGGSYQPATATAFATHTGSGPDPDPDPDPEPEPGGAAFECISGLGRYVRLEDGTTKEIQPLSIGLDAAEVRPGNGALQLRNAEVSVSIPGDLVLGLYADSHSLLAPGENTFPLFVWAGISASNTVEGTQTLGTESEWTTTITDPTPEDRANGDESASAVELDIRLPHSTWTPAGAGTVAFSAVPAGEMSTIGLIGKGYADTPYQVLPYGSVFLRAETANYGANLDCVAGGIDVANPDVRYSNLGREASAGRYAIEADEPTPFLVHEVDGTTGGVGATNQVVTVNVVGTPLRYETEGQLVSLPSGSPGSAVSGDLNTVTVHDVRGVDAGWSLTGQASELVGSNGSLPADSLGWVPSAEVVEGDGAVVEAGPAVAAPDGLGTPRALCSSPTGASNGTFTCGADLVLTIPSSASAGSYTGTITLTLA